MASFEMGRPDNRVEYDIWYSSSNDRSLDFISDFENTNSISSEMLERLLELKPQPDYNYFISVIIKSFIRRERIDLLKILFAKSSHSFLFKKNDISYEEALEIIKIAYAVGGVLRTLPKTKYQKLVPLLSDKYSFKSNNSQFNC